MRRTGWAALVTVLLAAGALPGPSTAVAAGTPEGPAAVSAVAAPTVSPELPPGVASASDPDSVEVASPDDDREGDPVDGVVPPQEVGTPLALDVTWRVSLARDLVVEVSVDDGSSWTRVWDQSFGGGTADSGTHRVTVDPPRGGRYRYRARLTAPSTGPVGEQVSGAVQFTLVNRPVQYATRVVLRAPSATRVRAGAKQVRIRGRVVDGAGRPDTTNPRRVTLRLTSGAGGDLGRTRTARDGRFAMTVPTSWYYAGRLRAFVDRETHPNTHGGEFDADTFVVAAARSGARPRIAVGPGYRPRGSRRWSRLTDLRWNPCSGPITYRINYARSPRGAGRHVQQAFRQVARATGLRFRYQGSTAKVPLYSRTVWPNYDPRSDLTIAWASPAMFDTFRGGVLGVGGSSGDSGSGYTKGLVQLNSAWNGRLRRGFGRGLTLGTLLLHEVGHAVGLGHASDRALVMNPSLGSFSQGRFGRGDLAGLRRLGRLAGCWTSPRRSQSRAATDAPTWQP